MIFYLDSPWTPDPGYSMYLYFNQKSYVDYSNYKNDHVDQLITEGLEPSTTRSAWRNTRRSRRS